MEQLKKRLCKGEPSAFSELYDQVGERLFQYVCSRLRSSGDAADVVQEIFARLAKSHKKLGKAENLNSYVFAVARNESIRWIARNRKHDTQEILADPSCIRGLDSDLEQQEWIQSILNRLDPMDQEIVQLKIYSELTFDELAAVICLPAATVATRYRRAIEKLARQLESPNRDTQPFQPKTTP